MSNEFLKLVVGLTSPVAGVRYHVRSLPDAQDRLVALVLAYLADDEGACTVSAAELAAHTCLDPTAVGRALKRNAGAGYVETIPSGTPNGRNTYRLVRAKLEAHQMDELVRRSGAVAILTEYGADVRYVHALSRAGIGMMSELGDRVSAYRANPTAREFGFDVYLKYKDDVRNIGPKAGKALLVAYDEWEAESSGSSGSSTMAT